MVVFIKYEILNTLILNIFNIIIRTQFLTISIQFKHEKYLHYANKIIFHYTNIIMILHNFFYKKYCYNLPIKKCIQSTIQHIL